MRRSKVKSLSMMVVSMLIFGSIGVFRRVIPLPSAFLAFARGILGGLFLLIRIRLRPGKGSGQLPAKSFLALCLTGAMIGMNWMLLFEAYRYTTVAVATLCYYMQPTLVILLSAVLFRERLTGTKAVCALVSVAGMVLVSGVIGAGASGSESPTGILLGLGAAALYAGVVLINKTVQVDDVYRKTTVQLFSAGITMIPYLLLTNGFSGLRFEPSTLLLLLLVGLVHTGIAYVLYFGSMSGLPVHTIAVLSYIDPVFALILSTLFLGEPFTPLQLAGAILIIGSAVFAGISGESRKSTAGHVSMQ